MNWWKRNGPALFIFGAIALLVLHFNGVRIWGDH